MIRPPPRSTLFPSTTLFRSILTDPRLRAHRFLSAARSPDRSDLFFGTDGMGLVRVDAATAERKRWARDRKSTRLNSSHVRISYAVFCLKKKKNIKLVPT